MNSDERSPGSPPGPVFADPAIGQIVDGRYRLTMRLGEGGMGEVYAAQHVHIEKRVAIKLLRSEILANEEAVTRFRQEARSASSIGHRNIIAIDDFGQLPDGRVYLAMELLHGAPLSDLVKTGQPPERLVDILIQTGHGLAAAHEKGIVHRDLKPENIFVTQTPEGEDLPKLLDFGIAKVSGADGENHLTRTGAVFGTPFYMAPEQALGQNVDHRADIYAMGVIMYEVFAGAVPFQGESFMGILTQHITTEPRPPAQMAAEHGRVLPPGIEAIIRRAMSKEPGRRHGSMAELTAELVGVRRALAGARVPRRKNRAVLIAVILASMAAAGGGLALLSLSHESSIGGPGDDAGANTTDGRVDAGAGGTVESIEGIDVRDGGAPATEVGVLVNSRPQGAEIIGPAGKRLGRTPMNLMVARGGRLPIILRLRGRKELRASIDDRRAKVTFRLERLRRPASGGNGRDDDGGTDGPTEPRDACDDDPRSIDCQCLKDPTLPVCPLE